MADNVNIPTTGSGDSGPIPVATDDISGIHYQKMKVFDGTADSTTPMAVKTLSSIAESDTGAAVQAPVLGVTTGSAVVTDANGTIQQYLRGIVKLLIAALTFKFSTPTTATLTSASVSVNTSGDNTLVSGTGGQTIRVFQLFLVVSAAVSVKFKDGASTDLTGAMSMTANGSITLDFHGEPYFVTTSGNGFILNLSSGQQVSGAIYYTKS